MSLVESAPSWLMNTLSQVNDDEILKVSIVLWGIWGWRNKRVWEGKVASTAVAMNNSFGHVEEWKIERVRIKNNTLNTRQRDKSLVLKWKPPDPGILKVDVDASFRIASENFLVGMVLRDHEGKFLTGRCMCLESTTTVLEAEAIAVREALSWIKAKQLGDQKVELETDSMLVVHGINKVTELVGSGGSVQSVQDAPWRFSLYFHSFR